jgi:MFS family permease
LPANIIITASTAIASFGLFLFSYLIDARATAIDIIIPLFVMAFGLGLGMAQRTSAIAAAVPAHEIGTASSILALARNIAGAFGIAIFGTVLQNSTESNVLTIARNSTLYVHTPEAMKAYIGLIQLRAQIDAYHTIFLLGMAVLASGAIAAIWLHIPENKGEKREEMVVLD